MYRFDDFGARQGEQVVVASERDRVVGVSVAAEIVLLQLVRLDHRTHSAVEDENAPAESVAEDFDSIRGGVTHISVFHSAGPKKTPGR